MSARLPFLAAALALAAYAGAAPEAKTNKPPADENRLQNPKAGPIFEKDVARPLRYRPEGTDFVIENGAGLFNRPLYSANGAFRADAGDRPEFALYLPGRGGNLRLGMRVGEKAKWLHEAQDIIARYRPGSMVYEIRDPILGGGVLRVTALGLPDSAGLIIKAEIEGASVGLLSAFGGANGDKDRSSVDIGCGPTPVNKWWQLKPEYCAGSEFAIDGPSFLLKSKAGAISGQYSADTKIHLGDASAWENPVALFQSSGSAAPVAVAISPLTARSPAYIVLKPVADGGAADAKMPDFAPLFAAAEKHRSEIASTIVVDTPDPFVNAAACALCTAGDAVWDEKVGSWMHGAVAWRVPLLGWRGDYIGDALGWPDRQRRFFDRWAAKQNTKPIPAATPPPFPKDNLSRNENALHSNGDMSGTHYDMNLVFIDALFRHLLWAGDLDYAKKMWPVIERHLAWERRMFRREFAAKDGEKLPLYEGYCCIWASDDLWYSGGGAAHSTAYNYYHNKMAAKVARLIGQDPAPYESEASLIARGMRELLWKPERGVFAESKDLLGLQRTRDNPFLATFYHTIDSEVPTATEAQQMMRYVDTRLAHIPIKGPGVPSDRPYFTLPTSNWMPYAWSINNVVMAESAHAALAYWQAGRPDTAFDLFKGALLDSMFMGLCPGNAGMCTQFDMARAESQRDFADGIGATSRALVEGLFGIRPDALAGELFIRPGFPESWDRAALKHPSISVGFKREGLTDVYTIEPKFPRPMALRLEVPAIRARVAKVIVNGRPSKWVESDDAGVPRIALTAPAAEKFDVAITWDGAKRETQPPSLAPAPEKVLVPTADYTKPIAGKAEPVNLESAYNDKVTQIFKNEYLSPRSPYCSLAVPRQGYGSWCHPDSTFEVDDAGLRGSAAKNGGRIALPNGIPLQTAADQESKNVAFVSLWDNYPDDLTVPLDGKASHAYLLMAGSTNPMQSRIDNGEVIVTYADGSTARLALRNPETWWPIDQDYVVDDYAFRYDAPIPPRVDLKTGKVRLPKKEDLVHGPTQKVPGGAATVLDLPLDHDKELKSLTVRALSNEVVIGLMAVTLER